MEQVNPAPHNHRFLYHFEIVVILLAIILVLFGLSSGVLGQTGGDPYANYNLGNVNYNQLGQPVSQANNNNPLWWQNPSVQNPNYTNNQNTGSGTQSGNTSGNQGFGGNSASPAGYYGNMGGTYNYRGINDPSAVPTQGGYNAGPGSGIYNSAGIIESSAVPTQGTTINSSGQGVFTGKYIDESLVMPTQQNTLSPKNCSFITKYHKFGDRGGDVPKIQQFLKDRGYYKGKIDGVYGISTFKAVQAFQRDYKDKILDPWEFNNKSSVQGTGITNISTKYAINNMVGCPDPATIVPATGRILNY